jgi:hypothetical protein
MTKHLCLILCMAAAAFGQPGPAPLPARALQPPPAPQASEPPKLTKFNLNFSGGTPAQLVAAIEKATGRPLNVVIPDEYAAERIPPLRMTQVTVAELFAAMEQASFKTELYRAGGNLPGAYAQTFSYQTLHTHISFKTSGGPVTDDSIWYFRGREKIPDYTAWETKPVPRKISRFYALTPYLEQDLNVEDITTAIQTGWKMSGEKDVPTISFHRETKLLIAVGEPEKLETIDAVLQALRQPPEPARLRGTPPKPASRATPLPAEPAAIKTNVP